MNRRQCLALLGSFGTVGTVGGFAALRTVTGRTTIQVLFQNSTKVRQPIEITVEAGEELILDTGYEVRARGEERETVSLAGDGPYRVRVTHANGTSTHKTIHTGESYGDVIIWVRDERVEIVQRDS